MKFLITFLAAAALAVPQTADAHNRHRPNPRATVSVGTPAVSVTWVWVPATRVYRAHWSHPTHGRDFGPNRPAARPNTNAVWGISPTYNQSSAYAYSVVSTPTT